MSAGPAERDGPAPGPVAFTVVVPVRDEAAHLAGLVEAFLAEMDREGADLVHEVLLAESGSTDGSREACGRLAARRDGLTRLGVAYDVLDRTEVPPGTEVALVAIRH